MSQEVNVFTSQGVLQPNQSFPNFSWNIGSRHEYIGLTAMPVGTNEAIQITNVRTTADANGNGFILFDLTNLTADTTDFTLTLTLP